MNRLIPSSVAVPYRRALATSSTATSFTAPAPTTTKPALAVELAKIGSGVPTYLNLIPIGITNNQTFDMRVIGWRPVALDTFTDLWVGTILLGVSVTLGNVVGVAGAAVLSSEYFADTMTVTIGNANVDYVVTSTANDTPAHVLVDTKGCPLVEWQFDMTGATNGNCLFAQV